MIKFGASFTKKKKMADTEFGPGTDFFEGMIGSENKVPGHKKVGARFPPKFPAPNLGLEPKPLSKICSEN